MIALIAIILCAYLGWRRFPFSQWPFGIVVFGFLGAVSIIFALHHDGFGPSINEKLIAAGISWIAAPISAYFAGRFVGSVYRLIAMHDLRALWSRMMLLLFGRSIGLSDEERAEQMAHLRQQFPNDRDNNPERH